VLLWAESAGLGKGGRKPRGELGALVLAAPGHIIKPVSGPVLQAKPKSLSNFLSFYESFFSYKLAYRESFC
jgi:hypothetical protein